MHRDLLQVVDHQPADDPGNQRAEEAGAEAVADPGADGAGGQRRAVGDRVADIGCQKRHHQRQPGHADIKQFFQVRVGGGIGHRALAVQHDGDCQQDPTGHDKRDHM